MVSRSNSITLVMTTNRTLFAHFNPITFLWTNTFDGDWEAATNWTPNLAPGSNDSVVIESQVTVTLDRAATCADVTLGGQFNSPVLTGTATLTVNGAFSWTLGTLSGTGRTILGPAATLNMGNAGSLNLNSRTLENRGIILWTGAGALNVGFGAAITNAPGALIEVQKPSLMSSGGGMPERCASLPPPRVSLTPSTTPG
jgi:hypothetical protein